MTAAGSDGQQPEPLDIAALFPPDPDLMASLEGDKKGLREVQNHARAEASRWRPDDVVYYSHEVLHRHPQGYWYRKSSPSRHWTDDEMTAAGAVLLVRGGEPVHQTAVAFLRETVVPMAKPSFKISYNNAADIVERICRGES